jgi:recombination protein RecA
MKKFPESGFDYHAKLILSDGSSELLGKIVTNRMKVMVKTYNFETQTVEHQLIEDWYRMPVEGNWLHVLFRGGRNGRSGFKCQPSQKLFTFNGERTAISLDVGDTVLRVEKAFYSELQHQILLGGLMGDSSLRFEKSPRGHMRFAHGRKQAEYMKYKASLLGLEVKCQNNGVTYADTERSEEFSRYRGVQKFKAILHLPEEYIDQLTSLSIAIWYMDDGTYARVKKYGAGKCSIAAKMLPSKELSLIADKIDRLGMGNAKMVEGKGLFFYGENSRLFQEGVSPYVPECMSYKISPWYRNTGKNFACGLMEPREGLYSCELIHKWGTVPAKGNRYKYSLKVKNGNCFMSGILVNLRTS